MNNADTILCINLKSIFSVITLKIRHCIEILIGHFHIDTFGIVTTIVILCRRSILCNYKIKKIGKISLLFRYVINAIYELLIRKKLNTLCIMCKNSRETKEKCASHLILFVCGSAKKIRATC